MDYQAVFKRFEIKYIISFEQCKMLKNLMKQHMVADKYGNSTVCNIYFDTQDFLLVRRSIEKPIYKEKLRLRSYGVCSSESVVFVELKKKFESVVYKRRIEMNERNAMNCLCKKAMFPKTQIGNEITYCFSRYSTLSPKVFLSYERQAFYDKTDDSFRMTFDKNIIWRDYDLSLCKGVYGNKILNDDEVLLEVKTSTSLPLWLVRFFSENKIYRTSFSKYGAAYASIVGREKLAEGVHCA